jgi:hypothetical protein
MGDVNSISQQDADRRMESKRLRLIDPKPALSMISVLTAQRIFQSSHLLQFSFSISQLPRLRGAASKQRAPAADEQTSPRRSSCQHRNKSIPAVLEVLHVY